MNIATIIFPVINAIGVVCLSSAYAVIAILAMAVAIILVVKGIKIKKQINALSVQFFKNENKSTSEALAAFKERFKSQEENLEKAIKELESLGKNEYNHVSQNIQGPLGDALTNLQSRLAAIKLQESQQNWLVQGMAELGRIKGNNISQEDYAYQTINFVIKYLSANQGGFFGMNEDKKNLKLLAAYAYGRKKYRAEDLVIEVGCGLLGQSVLERDIIYMTNLPKDYLKITSGLGEATPRCIAIVPLFYRDLAYGVLEIASFQVLEEYQKEFLRKASAVIASELSNVNNQIQTKKLLDQAQDQAHQLSSQEEELRQSMEEMSATQEEMRRKEIALEEKLEEIEAERAKNVAILESCADGVISFNELGHIEFTNVAAQDMLGFVKEELLDKTVEGLLGILINYDKSGQPQLLARTGNQITSRTEVNTIDRFGNEVSLLITAARVKVRGKSLFTLFAQKISVDLF